MPPPEPPAKDFNSRFQIQKYDRAALIAALTGSCLPAALGLPLARLCTIRGIRYNPNFGHELYSLNPAYPPFTRALNARRIMSNEIPDMQAPEDFPYCIWHPEVATEENYRRLVERYPCMRYQVARACAVAGYERLYNELENLLPEVHVAEEAREAGERSRGIYEKIVNAPVRYSVFDDYNRELHLETPKVADLNGDTAVKWMLDIKQPFTTATTDDADTDSEEDEMLAFALSIPSDGFSPQQFNITEDMNIGHPDIHASDSARQHTPAIDLRSLLVNPLSRDLPTVQKDLLIVMAAYHGNLERYTRLRRPVLVPTELDCIVRGIYHHPFFAVWWQDRNCRLFDGDTEPHGAIRQAVNARLIMSNVLSGVNEPGYVRPYLIWHPTVAQETTYRALALAQPKMVVPVLRACMAGHYTKLFDELVACVPVTLELMREATNSGETHFRETLARRLAEQGGEMEDAVTRNWPGWMLDTARKHLRASGPAWIGRGEQRGVGPGVFVRTQVHTGVDGLYNGVFCDSNEVDLEVCLPEEWRLQDGRDADLEDLVQLNYAEWPRGWLQGVQGQAVESDQTDEHEDVYPRRYRFR